MARICSSVLLFLLISLFVSYVSSEIRFTEIRSDSHPIIPLDQFGFTHTGRLELNVSRISLSNKNPDLDLAKIGFFLSTLDAWMHVLQQLADGEVTCVLESGLVKRVTDFKAAKGKFSFDVVVPVNNAEQYALVFANCLSDVKVSMTIRSAMYNLEGRDGHRDYLSAGKTILPRNPFLYAVFVLKAFNLIFEAEDKSYIKRTGSAHGWDVLFYIFSFLKGIMLFTLIVLIGTGWSFLKPFLQDKEKKVLMIVIPLQVVANIAQVVVDETSPFGEDRVTWKQVFLLVDVICCCAVLFPIVWSIKNLRETARTDGKAAVNLMKLTLFRQYYIVVICYVYFTRVVVYALETITSYKYFWTSVLAGELATLAFYVFTGYKFKPEAHNPYLAIGDEEEEAAAEQLKLEDEFEL
ncbi:hypothetical protein F3Y22_tig00110569pilonHSYRG00069 [Hibiscus syriacus]|uniref:Protein GPR107 n=1 Tax=Hibiscus syriacus TaxID=106335 RepID=A0A6A3A9J9_HIBSY|nr:hypothetical protein F3Y22_tig00110569pilonHSYRG00069 [Hibiscus syriacus]